MLIKKKNGASAPEGRAAKSGRGGHLLSARPPPPVISNGASRLFLPASLLRASELAARNTVISNGASRLFSSASLLRTVGLRREKSLFLFRQPTFFREIALILWLVIKGARPPALDAAPSSSAAG